MSNEPGTVLAFASGYQFSNTDLRVEGNAKVEQLEEGISYGCVLLIVIIYSSWARSPYQRCCRRDYYRTSATRENTRN
jgi:hypothetical protein